MSIGARSQSAKTYLEKHFTEFAECRFASTPLICILSLRQGTLESLVQHGLHALRETLQQDKELTIHNTSLGVVGPAGAYESDVGPEGNFRIIDGEQVDIYLKSMVPKEDPSAATAAPPGGPTGTVPGATDVQMNE